MVPHLKDSAKAPDLLKQSSKSVLQDRVQKPAGLLLLVAGSCTQASTIPRILQSVDVFLADFRIRKVKITVHVLSARRPSWYSCLVGR